MNDSAVLTKWLGLVAKAASDPWNPEVVSAVGELRVPAAGSTPLVDCDLGFLRHEWVVEGIIDLAPFFEDETLHFGYFYASVKQGLLNAFPSAPHDEIEDGAALFAKPAWRLISARRAASRERFSRPLRHEVWLNAQPEARCHLCGFHFDEPARERFLGRAPATSRSVPLLVDLARPRGLQDSDREIAIDHVNPVAAGGATEIDNLRLACGWCNAHKGDLWHLFNSPRQRRRRIRHPAGNWLSVPAPFWVVRLVRFRGRCEHAQSCQARLNTHELFVAPSGAAGALNPLNARVYCEDHDPWNVFRWVSPATLR